MKDNKIESRADWDWTHLETKPPMSIARVRVVVSVSLSREQFILISECAERLGKSTSQFIREAAMDKVSGGPRVNITTCD